ncbi:MAG TPA: nucleotidyltransferase domain-containing protein [Candidatus Hodarchaeales archaeon]|nr:nucleotidyltransferase domain-containing protein [Candidatus Hodarchaeales archaeon]
MNIKDYYTLVHPPTMRPLVDDIAHNILNSLMYDRELSFSGLLKVGCHNSRTLSKKLSELYTLSLVEKKNASYQLTTIGKKVTEGLNEILNSIRPKATVEIPIAVPESLRYALTSYVQLMVGQFGSELGSVVLFGSHAKCTQNETSDIDLLLLFRSPIDLKETLEKLARCRTSFRSSIEYRLLIEKGLDFRVQHLPFHSLGPLRYLGPFLDIALEGRALFDPDRIFLDFKVLIGKEAATRGLVRVTKINGVYYWQVAL